MAKVAMCAGHGGSGSTAGKRTPAGEYEWNFNNKVVNAAIAVLRASGHEVLRLDDPTGKTDVPLKTRTDRANSWGADIYISVHHNAMGSRWRDEETGIETFTQNGNYPEAERLAAAVHPLYVKAMGLRDRGVKKMNLHITRETRMPAILTEGGFMDSRHDVGVMRDDDKLKAQGEAIAKGAIAYLGDKIVVPKETKIGGETVVNKPTKPTGGGSIVNWMSNNGMNSSYDNRARLAAQHGIKNFSGTADQNTQLLGILQRGHKPAKPAPSRPVGNQSTGSIVTYLDSIGVDSSYTNRARLAQQNGIRNYSGTASQNTQLLNTLRGGGSVKAQSKPAVRAGEGIVSWMNRAGMDSSYENRERLAKQHGITNYRGSAAQNSKLLSIVSS